MSTYREIHGKAVKSLGTDPSAEIDAGQIWYNTSSDTFKSIVNIAAWSSAAPMITARDASNGGGTQTEAIVFGGLTGPGSPNKTALTEEYNGSGFAAGGALTTARYDLGGTGLQTAALAVGGTDGPSSLAIVEEYNGTAWSEETNIPAVRKQQAVFGTQTAAVMTAGSPALTTSFKYDGSSWTSTGALSTGRSAAAKGSGTQTAGLCVGGQVPAVTNATEEFNGSSWTTGGDLNSARKYAYGGGIQTSSLIAGGNTGSRVTSTELYNGSSWTTSSNLGTAIESGGSAVNSPSNTAGLTMGGYATAVSALTEEFNNSANVITGGAWSSGGSLGTGRYQANGQNVGTKSAGLMIGGQGSYPPSNPAVTISNVEEYDGSSWSEVTNFPTTRAMLGSVGTQTAAFAFGGYGKPGGGPNPAPSSPNFDTTFNYDGSSWTSETAMPSAIAYLTGAGTQTAVLSIGGYPAVTACNEYDGSSWTGGGAMTTGRHNGSAFGIQTAAIIAGGAPGVTTDVESYNGSSWTSAATLILAKEQGGTAGTQTDGLITLGNQPNPTNSAGYNGTAWFTQPSTSTARYGGANGGTTLASAYYAGGEPSRSTTEEFTGGTSAINVKTLTQS